MDEQPDNQPPKRNLDGYTLGINLLVSTGIGGLAGYGLDSWLDTKPLWMIILLFLGFAAGIYQVWLTLNQQG